MWSISLKSLAVILTIFFATFNGGYANNDDSARSEPDLTPIHRLPSKSEPDLTEKYELDPASQSEPDLSHIIDEHGIPPNIGDIPKSDLPVTEIFVCFTTNSIEENRKFQIFHFFH